MHFPQKQKCISILPFGTFSLCLQLSLLGIKFTYLGFSFMFVSCSVKFSMKCIVCCCALQFCCPANAQLWLYLAVLIEHPC